jgi:hypothetical protein
MKNCLQFVFAEIEEVFEGKPVFKPFREFWPEDIRNLDVQNSVRCKLSADNRKTAEGIIKMLKHMS